MSKPKKNITKLITSVDQETIGNRFVVKISIMDNGVNKKSILIVTRDLLDGGFSMKFVDTEEEVRLFIKLLSEATK